MGDCEVSLNTSITAFKLSASPDDELEWMARLIGLVLCYPTIYHVDLPDSLAYYSFLFVYLFKILFVTNYANKSFYYEMNLSCGNRSYLN